MAGSADQTSQNVSRGAGAGISAGGLRSRVTASKANASKTSAKPTTQARAPATAGKAGFSIRLYDDDAPGLKVGPTAVLIGSLVYIASVVLLHIWGKFRASSD